MRIGQISSYSIVPKAISTKFLHKMRGNSNIITNTIVGFAIAASTLLQTSCLKDEYIGPDIKTETNNTPTKPKWNNDDYILPDTVSQAYLQNIPEIHNKIDVLFQSLKIIDKNKSIDDISTIEFEDASDNIYKFTDVQKNENGYILNGTVNHNGTQETATLKLTDAESIIHRPLICIETAFNKKHNLSLIYQNRWRKGSDGTPERRLFQNRTNTYVTEIDGSQYYPYDYNNIFALRASENGINSLAINNGPHFTEDEEIKNIKVSYKN